MRKLYFAVAAAALVGLFAGSAWAEGLPSAKTAVIIIPDALVVDEVSPGPDTDVSVGPAATLLLTKIKTGQKDLLLSLSVECGLFTSTLSKSKGGTKDTSKVTAEVRLSIEVDGVLAVPGEVTFCKRSQELSATFQGIFQTGDETAGFILTEENSGGSDDGLVDAFFEVEDDCKEAGDAVLTTDENTCEAITVIGTCLFQDTITGAIFLDVDCLTPEELRLATGSMTANAFNFLYHNALRSSVHTIRVIAFLDTGVAVGGTKFGEAAAQASIGLGSMQVETIRLIRGADITSVAPICLDGVCL